MPYDSFTFFANIFIAFKINVNIKVSGFKGIFDISK